MAKKRPSKLEQHGQIVRANVNRQVEQSPTFVSLYTNDTQLQVTPWDIRMIFGLVVEAPTVMGPSPKVLIKTVGEVRMSPQHAKKVATILIQQLKHYEETLGPIPQPPEN